MESHWRFQEVGDLKILSSKTLSEIKILFWGFFRKKKLKKFIQEAENVLRMTFKELLQKFLQLSEVLLGDFQEISPLVSQRASRGELSEVSEE